MNKNGRFAAASRTGHPGITFLMDPSPSVIRPSAGFREMPPCRRKPGRKGMTTGS